MSRLLLGARYREKLDGPLRALGFNPLYVPDNPDIDPRLAGHADLSVFPAGEKRVYLAPYLRESDFAAEMEASGFHILFPPIRQQTDYPHDAQLNLCPVGSRLLYYPKSACKEIVMFLTNKRGLLDIPVRQGYTRCSACVIDGESLIAADRGLAGAAEAAGLTVLRIRPGAVSLPGFAYGFLGGAAFLGNDKELVFTGRLDQHPDKASILEFLEKRTVTPRYLTDEPVFDIGGAFVL